jgi:antiviral defense system Shedu protein SduA
VSLFERAIEFVRAGYPKDEPDLLRDCIQARNPEGLFAVQRLYEDMYGDMTFNFELKAPAAWCLLCWGKAGIDALIEGVKRTPSSKNTSLTVQILSTVAAGTDPAFLFLADDLKDLVTTALKDTSSLQVFARQRLTEYMLSLSDDVEASEVAAIGFQRLSLLNTQAEASKELFAALASRWLVVGAPTIARYRRLIADCADDENAFQRFFEDVPQLLDPLCSMMWPKPDLHGAKEPDFVLKRSDGSYLIVEIESPAKRLVTDALQTSAQVTQAVTQAMQYRSFLVDRSAETRVHFPEFRDPECLVVIGIESSLSEDQKRALALDNENRKGLRIVGFDWIAERADRILSNMISANIAVRPLRMI